MIFSLSTQAHGPSPPVGFFLANIDKKSFFCLYILRLFTKNKGEITVIIIQLGNLVAQGDASTRLLGYISGHQFPLAGIAELPYVPGSEILENFSDRLHYPKVCYLIKKGFVIQLLREIAPGAIKEIREKFFGLTFLPFRISSCEIVM